MTQETCNTCGKIASNPFRMYEGDKIVGGCVDGFHTGHLVEISESSRWHNRREAKAIRKTLADMLHHKGRK